MIAVYYNLATELGAQLRGSGCKPYGSDLRVYIEKNSLFTYPDLSIICGKKESRNNDDFNILNPSVLFEVLSESSKDYDRGSKFMLYRDIPTLKTYVIIDSLSLKVEAYSINSGGLWELNEYSNISDTLLIPNLNISIALKDIYDGVNFE